MTESTNAFEGSEGNLALDPAPVADAKPKKSHHAAPKDAASKPVALGAARRTRIVLEDNDQIGPSGQFFGADGKGYMLRPGEEAEVPDSILNILDTAMASMPVVDSSQTVIGYRDRLRFPYRVITSRRGAQ